MIEIMRAATLIWLRQQADIRRDRQVANIAPDFDALRHRITLSRKNDLLDGTPQVAEHKAKLSKITAPARLPYSSSSHSATYPSQRPLFYCLAFYSAYTLNSLLVYKRKATKVWQSINCSHVQEAVDRLHVQKRLS